MGPHDLRPLVPSVADDADVRQPLRVEERGEHCLHVGSMAGPLEMKALGVVEVVVAAAAEL